MLWLLVQLYCLSETSDWLCVSLCVYVRQPNDNIRRKQVGISCVKQSGTPKYVVYVLREAVSKKYIQQH